MIDIHFLQTHSLFGGIDDEALKKIRPYLKETFFPMGALIIEEGVPNGRLHFIQRGQVEIVKKAHFSENDALERIAVLGTGDTFGEMELIDIQPPVASVRALEDTYILLFSNHDLYEVRKWSLETFTLIVMNMAREISRRLRKMDALIASTLYAANQDHYHGSGSSS